MKKLLLMLALTLLAAGLAGCGNSSGNVAVPEKPVLYLYPEEEMEVTVTLDFDGTLTSTYPAYGDGWTVTARPDGTLTNPATGREYYCLFWEGITEAEYDFSAGFCVAGEDTADLEQLRQESKEIKDKIDHTEERLMQLKNQEQKILKQNTVKRRKERTHRLITRRPILESFIENAEELTDEEIKILLEEATKTKA